jgi:multiple sugar transport system substrate-binding protein
VLVSLRARLIAGLLALAAVGLLVLAGVTYAEQRRFLYDRVDQQARAAPFAVAVALSACGAPDHTVTSTPAARTPMGTPMPVRPLAHIAASGALTAYGASYVTGDLVARTRIDEFARLYPDVRLTFSESPFDDEQFAEALAASDRPDVVNLPRDRIGAYVAQGVLAPVDDCAVRVELDPGVFYDAARADVTVGGAMYGLPEFYNTRYWFLNDRAFDEADIDPERFDFSDRDAIADANARLTVSDAGGIARIGIDPRIPEMLPLWASAGGGAIVSDDGRTAQLDTQPVVDALTYAAGLVGAQPGTDARLAFRDTWDVFGDDNPMAANQIGAWLMPQSYLDILARSTPEVNITLKPFLDPGGRPVTLEDGNAWAIVAGSDNPDAACAFVSTMVWTGSWVAAAAAASDEARANDRPQTGIYTGNREADAIIFAQHVDLGGLPVFADAVQVVLGNQEHAFGLPPTAASAAVERAMAAGVERVLSDGASPGEAMAQAQQEAQAAIDRAAH